GGELTPGQQVLEVQGFVAVAALEQRLGSRRGDRADSGGVVPAAASQRVRARGTADQIVSVEPWSFHRDAVDGPGEVGRAAATAAGAETAFEGVVRAGVKLFRERAGILADVVGVEVTENQNRTHVGVAEEGLSGRAGAAGVHQRDAV